MNPEEFANNFFESVDFLYAFFVESNEGKRNPDLESAIIRAKTQGFEPTIGIKRNEQKSI